MTKLLTPMLAPVFALTIGLTIGVLLGAQTKPSPMTPTSAAAPAAAQGAVPDVPKLPEDLLKEYWHAVAAHHAMTAQIAQAQANLASADKSIEGIREKLKAVCGDKAVFNENTQPDPACVARQEPPPPDPAPTPAPKK